jgi:hypothetical protein
MAGAAIPAGYVLSFFREDDDKVLFRHAAFPALPAPGTVVILPALGLWEVAAVQVIVFEPGSYEADHALPLYADVIVRPGENVHQGRQGDGG